MQSVWSDEKNWNVCAHGSSNVTSFFPWERRSDRENTIYSFVHSRLCSCSCWNLLILVVYCIELILWMPCIMCKQISRSIFCKVWIVCKKISQTSALVTAWNTMWKTSTLASLELGLDLILSVRPCNLLVIIYDLLILTSVSVGLCVAVSE